MTGHPAEIKKTLSPLPGLGACPLAVRPRPLLGLGIAILIFMTDQLSKWVALKYLLAPPHFHPVTSWLNIVLAWNRGISFGLFSGPNPYNVWIFSAIASGFAALLIFWIWHATTKLTCIAFGLILGGAIGNLADRIRFGAVTDFLDFHLYGYHWYTFNIADGAIVIGVGLIILEYFKEIGAQKNENTPHHQRQIK